jgi:hypothetical protein
MLESTASKATAVFLTRPALRLSLPVGVLLAAVALVVATAALSVTMDESSRWTEALAAAGIGSMVASVAVVLSTSQGWASGRGISLAGITTGIVGIGAVALAVVTYAGAGDDGTAGITQTNIAPSQEGAALSEQVSNNEIQPPGYAHDVGTHPAYEEFVRLDNASLLRSVPGGTLLPNEVDVLKGELAAARAFAEQHNTVEKAQAAGFYNTTNDVPFMGAHFLNNQYLTDGVFDAGKPEGLLFSKLGDPNGEWQLVGVWYLLIPGVTQGVTETLPPEGFAGNLDLWHTHYGLCTRDGVISENNTADGCRADNGRWIGDLRWMMHVWVWPEAGDNPEGVFTYLNAELYEKQQGLVATGP